MQSIENKSEDPKLQKNFLQIIWDSMSYKEILEPAVNSSLENADKTGSKLIPAQGMKDKSIKIIKL